MNLLTLQICKEEAEKMINDPRGWLGPFSLPPNRIKQIEDQGHRTLMVINAYEHYRKARMRGIKTQ